MDVAAKLLGFVFLITFLWHQRNVTPFVTGTPLTVRLLKKKTIHLKRDRKHNKEAKPSYKNEREQ